MVERIGNPNRRRSIITVVGIVLLVLVGLFLVFGLNISGSTKPIKDIADKFDPGSGWQFEDEDVRPPRFFCLDGGSCPQLYHRWTSTQFNSVELFNRVEAAGWNYSKRDGCESLAPNSKKDSILCWVDAHNDKYVMDLWVENRENNTVELTLYIKPK